MLGPCWRQLLASHQPAASSWALHAVTCSSWIAALHHPATLLDMSPEEQRRNSGLHACSTQSVRCASSSSQLHAQPMAGQETPPLQEQPENVSRVAEEQPLAQADTLLQQQHDLMGRVLLQPLPVGSVLNSSLHDAVVELEGNYYMDPAKTLESTMRVLHIVKQVLSSDGYVGIVNCNPVFQPLMQEAALHCSNANVFWHWGRWEKGLLSKGLLINGNKQPFRSLLKSRGMAMVNVHSPKADPLSKPQPSLAALHKWRLLSRRNWDHEKKPRTLLREILAAETQAARLPLEGSLTGKSGRLQLLVNLDLSFGEEAIQEAYNHGLLTASVVNAHTPLDRVTYPIYAGEGHPSYQHFFLDWLLKAVNVLTPEEEEASNALRQQGLTSTAARRAAEARHRINASVSEHLGRFRSPAGGGGGRTPRPGLFNTNNNRPQNSPQQQRDR
ncbi:hypothetical protein DUNSADRAFT_3578 [Dunaliella salina]|uniref:Uncharacterized protein n=1 Tax=Dunaliella salina TaxID=3046 RepID=A0ABQ7GTQ3_DUNSA|nr:hypothetical protein DUNSADRAFT_3578 [Dunaliella salina]|eukprot:KAF5837985.1 hypothetical protein DUNSADRAFT_3578 [Dunaliella salina]